MKKILETDHPNLYGFTSKDSLDYYFEKGIMEIQDSLDEETYRNKVGYIVEKIRCGHTSVRFSKDYYRNRLRQKISLFPLYLKSWGDSLVVLANSNDKDSVLKRGTIVLSINGRKNKTIIDSMKQLVNTDGYADIYKTQLFSSNFPYWYKLAWGIDSIYSVAYLDNSKKVVECKIRNVYYLGNVQKKKTTVVSKSTTPLLKKQPIKKTIPAIKINPYYSLQIDTLSKTAWMKISSFSGHGLRRFFRRSFYNFHKLSIDNLSIDIRENLGGKIINSNLLTKYLIDKPFKTGDTIAAKHRGLRYLRYIPMGYLYWFPMQFTHKGKDGLYHFKRLERHYMKPKKKNHFQGKVAIIQGGYSFSAASLFSGALKGQKNVAIIGEETGGGYCGNNAVYLPTIILPNSKLRVVLPTYHLVVDKNRPNLGRGVMPDIPVYPSSDAIKKGVDLKMVATKEWFFK